MSISKVDAKKRIVLPGGGEPGDVFDVQQQAEGRFLLVRLEKPKRAERMSRRKCMEAMQKAPLRPSMTWEKLRDLTREPSSFWTPVYSSTPLTPTERVDAFHS